MRLDKWLWCARFFRSRKLAADAIRKGRIRQNGGRIKPARTISPGECISIRKGPYTWTVTIRAMADTRLSAPEATTLYAEHEDSMAAREKLAMQLKSANAGTPHPRARPDKRERRERIRFTRRRG